MTVPATDLPSNLVPKDDLPGPASAPRVSAGPQAVPKDDLPGAAPTRTATAGPAAAPSLSPVAKGKPLDNAVRIAKVAQHKAAIDPMGALDAVLGAPERGLFSLVAHHGDLGHAWQAMTHPGREDDADVDAVLGALHIPIAKGNDLGSKVERTLVRGGAKIIGDPLNAIPLMAPFKMAAKGVDALRIASEAAGAVGAKVPGVERTMNAGRTLAQGAYKRVNGDGFKKFANDMFGRRPELDQHLNADLKGTRLGVEFKHRSYEAQAVGAAHATLHDPATRVPLSDLPAGTTLHDLPQGVRNVAGQQLYRHGDAEGRQAALDHGYVPTNEDHETFPKPTGDVGTDLWTDLGEKIATGGDHTKTVNDTMRQGYAQWRNGQIKRETQTILDKRVDDARHFALEKDPELAKDPAALEAQAKKDAGWMSEGPPDAALLSNEGKQALKGSPMRAITRLQKAAIKLNPFPHGLKNVGTLAYLQGGPEAFGGGLGYAMKGLDATKTDMHGLTQGARLINSGVDADYVRDIEHPLTDADHEMSGLERGTAALTSLPKGWVAGSNKILTRLELGYRQALMDQLDKKMPRLNDAAADAALDFKKGAIIRAALGDYRNVSYFVSALDAIGGPFVAFRLGIVPGAVTRALVRRPGFVEAPVHAQETWNSTMQQGSPSEMEQGGPVRDAAGLAANPFGAMESPSTIGPLGVAMRYGDPNRTVGGGAIADEALRDFVPGAGMLEDLGVMKSILSGGYDPAPGVSPGASGFASLLGAYYRKKPSPVAEHRFESAEKKAP